jgi:diacylglycerol kinase (ATP)
MTTSKSSNKTLLLLNPVAGKGKGKKIFDPIHAHLTKAFSNIEVAISQFPGHLTEICREAVTNGFERYISIGGDGTPYEIINGIYANGIPEQKIQLGMIPAGTGNSFLRDFGEVDQQLWLDKICNGNSRKVDLIEFSYFQDGKEKKQYYINILGIGLISDILKLTNKKLKFLGRLGYSLAVLIRLFQGMNNSINITVDDRYIELENSALVISNSKFTGGEMKIAPMADTGDGKVDMIIFNRVNRREILNIFANVFKGTHTQHPKVDVVSGSLIEIDAEPQLQLMADGELLGHTPMKLKVLPGQLTIMD